MNKKTTLVALLLLTVMLFQFFPAPQKVAAATTCDWAQFVADVTIPDGTMFKAGESFNKTWRLKNVGSCTWGSDYQLTFVSGDQMGAPASVKFSKTVAPGQTIDLTVTMTAPANAGTYRSYWQLKNAAGVLFGIGSMANKSFWAEIKVAGGGSATDYDFVAEAGNAAWTSGAGALTFPGTDGDAKGFARKVDSPKLENGTTDSAPGLLTAPQNVYGGYIQGVYPAFKVQSGDRFQSIVNCEYNATSCYVNFRLDYQIGSGAVRTFWSFNERYEGLFYRANLDLSSLAGQDVKFILYVGAAGYATGDRALWGAPRITRSGVGPTITPTFTGTPPTPTNTPNPSSCDRATFIADVNVPDGTVFAPNATFKKTWRVKNVGTCTWTTAYSLVFVSGEKMGGADSNLTSTIGPNTSFDVSVNLKAPAANGTYRGYWQFKNDKGQVFGIGSTGDKPFWVEIVVKDGTTITSTPTPTPVPGTGVYDFAANASAAKWSSGAGDLPFPGSDGDAKGFAIKFDSIQLETGATETRPTLLTFPQNKTDGYIQALYPAFDVKSGDHFRATIGCQYGATGCYVTYRLDYRPVGGAVKTFWTFRERYDGLTYDVNLDLSPLAGQKVEFFLLVLATGPVTGDRALWVAPRITRDGTSGPTVTPSPTTTTGSLGPYGVVNIAKNDTLNVRSGAGIGYPIVTGLAYNASNVMRTGPASAIDGAVWWELEKPGGGKGWSNSSYLTEYVAPATFCADTRVNTLLNNLGTALKNSDGAALAALVNAAHGVDIRFQSNNSPVNFNKTAVAGLFSSTTAYNWGPAPGSGQDVVGTFKDSILPKLLEVVNSANIQTSCNDVSKVGPVSQPWPFEYVNVNFYSLYKPGTAGTELDWRDWLVGIEFVDGKPYLFSLVNFQWVP